MERVECIVIGAGVIGLAAARALALQGREVLIIEQAAAIGTETSSRNSEVIHAGLYYAGLPLKARLCVEGKGKLYAYCRERGIAHQRLGKLIVAVNAAQVPKLHALKQQGEAAGVDDLMLLSADQARALEPELVCAAALHSPSTGIIDSHGLMLSLQGEAEATGAVAAFNTPVERISISGGGFTLETGGASPMMIGAKLLINAAGHGAVPLAVGMQGFPPGKTPRQFFAKGHYFSLAGSAPFSRLIYPMHDAAGLGIHITLDLAGQGRFGPDVKWVDGLNYAAEPARAESFYAAIRSYWPGLKDGALLPSYTGIRPKIVAPGEPPADFLIQFQQDHGIAGLVNLFGIESPGLTSSLAIADEVAKRLG